jgi:sugar-specific transcriptional regulator TrmB
MLEKYLEELGFQEKEALIYLALLECDHLSVAQLATKTDIKRPTVYVVLETLEKKGLVSETQVGKKTHYMAESPDRLETYVERQRLVFDERAKRVKDIIPQIKGVQRTAGERPVVRYFEGREGILSSLEEIYGPSSGENGLSHFIYSSDLLDEIFSKDEREKYRSLRLKKNVRAKSIYTRSAGDREQGTQSDRVRVDGEKYPLSCDIQIHENKVRISILGEFVSGILIESKDLADTMRSIFALAFEEAKEQEAGRGK